MNREELRRNIEEIVFSSNNIVNDLEEFILEDRKRILSPLIKYKNEVPPYPYWIEAIDETLKLAVY